MGIRDKLKGLEGKTKGKVSGAGDWLKQKWTVGSLKKGPTKPETGKPTEPKKDLLEGMVEIGPTLELAAKEAGFKGYGRGEEVKKKSFFGGIKEKYGKWSEERSKKKREELAEKKMRKCLYCGTVYEKTADEPCPKCGFNVSQQKQAAKLAGRPVKGEGGKLGEGIKLPSIRGGSRAALLISITGLIASFMWGMPAGIMMIFAILLALGIISFLLPPWFAKYILIPTFIVGTLFLYFTGQFKAVEKAIPVAYAEQLREAYENAKEPILDMYEKSKCYAKFDPAQVTICLKELEKKEKEEIANPYKEYQTLEVKAGNPYLNYEYITPEGGKSYDLELNFINKNEKTFKIELTDINVTFGDQKGIGLDRYTLEPKEEKYARFNFLPEIVCDSNTFKVNITANYTAGGTSQFGMAPNEEGDNMRFLRGFKPNAIADPGPLNIYAFTYPAGINASNPLGLKIWDNKFQVIIKIKNPKVEGVATVSDFYLIQKFRFEKYFDISENECEGPKEMKKPVDRAPSKCAENEGNCLQFRFDPPLALSKAEYTEIKCNATIVPNIDSILTDKYTDFIRVESAYNFNQVWEFSLGCTAATTTTTTSEVTATTHEVEVCLKGGSLVLTPNGFRKIEDLKEGDYVIGYEDGGRVESKIIETSSHYGGFKLYFYKGYWFTGNHLVYTDDYKGFKPVSELSNITEYYEGEVYNIQVESKNYFGENGLLIHNK